MTLKYEDLRGFIAALEQRGELKRIQTPVDPYLEMTEICDRTLRAGGPAPSKARPATEEVSQAAPYCWSFLQILRWPGGRSVNDDDDDDDDSWRRKTHRYVASLGASGAD